MNDELFSNESKPFDLQEAIENLHPAGTSEGFTAKIMTDNHKRFHARKLLEQAGCKITGYFTNGMAVAIKRGRTGAISAAAILMNGKLEDDMHYFPLGSDHPEEEYRHDGNYPGSKGFWLYGKVIFE